MANYDGTLDYNERVLRDERERARANRRAIEQSDAEYRQDVPQTQHVYDEEAGDGSHVDWCPACVAAADVAVTAEPLTIRIASAPCGASAAFMHPACCGTDLRDVEYHDLTIAELLDQQITVCDACGERIVPKGVHAAQGER